MIWWVDARFDSRELRFDDDQLRFDGDEPNSVVVNSDLATGSEELVEGPAALEHASAEPPPATSRRAPPQVGLIFLKYRRSRAWG
jgi:hypothetical protein